MFSTTQNCLAALTALTLLAPAAHAALVLQSEAASYSIDAAGTQTADVRLYLAQTDGTTTLSDGGGLNSAGFIVTAATSGAPTLTTIAANLAFGNATPSLAGGTLYEERPDLSSGVAVDAGRVFLGTFSYRFTGGNAAASTTFTVADRAGTDGFYTASGTLLDASIAPGTFAIVVPEPATLAALGSVGVVAVRRRRRRVVA